MITEIIKILQSGDYFGGGNFIEIAKGKHQYISSMRVGGRKIKREWQSKRR